MGRDLDRRVPTLSVIAPVLPIAFRLLGRVLATLALGYLVASTVAVGQIAGDSDDPPRRVASSVRLKDLSLEDLMQIEVSTVSRKTEPWWTAAGAIDVVTSDDIERSGALTLPDALRLATGVHVGQANTQAYAVGIRGFNVLSNDKVNVQLDGRNLFTPFFSGVAWDMQGTLLEDVDRIEVVRGPAGALWGNYAMNGFINIETKPAWDTQGLLATAAIGTELPGAVALRYGGTAGRNTYYRAFLQYTDTDWTYNAAGHRAKPPTDVVRGGFRSDTRTAGDGILTIDADAYTNRGTPEDRPDQERFSGESIGARWHRSVLADSDLQVRGYVEHTWHVSGGNFVEKRNTASASVKYRAVAGRHDWQVGADALVSRDRITSGTTVSIVPPERTYYTNSLYASDTITLVPRRWVATVGAQLQWAVFSGLDVQPTARLAWTPTADTTIWGAISRAVRTPVRLDAGLHSEVNGTVFFHGNPGLKSEDVIAEELGIRHRFSQRLAVDLAMFVNDYHHVRTYESATPVYRALPWTFGNSMHAHSTGAEVTVLYQPWSRLFLKASYRYLDLRLHKNAGSGDFLNGLFEANDPRHVGSLTARLNPAPHWTLDATVRGTSGLPQPAMRGYVTCDARVAWSPDANWEVAVVGQNLSDAQHPEFVTPNSSNEEVARSVTIKATWRF